MPLEAAAVMMVAAAMSSLSDVHLVWKKMVSPRMTISL